MKKDPKKGPFSCFYNFIFFTKNNQPLTSILRAFPKVTLVFIPLKISVYFYFLSDLEKVIEEGIYKIFYFLLLF